jgi:hypothetical protein
MRLERAAIASCVVILLVACTVEQPNPRCAAVFGEAICLPEEYGAPDQKLGGLWYETSSDPVRRTVIWMHPASSLDQALDEMLATGIYRPKASCLVAPNIHLRELRANQPRSVTILLGNETEFIQVWAIEENDVLRAVEILISGLPGHAQLEYRSISDICLGPTQ